MTEALTVPVDHFDKCNHSLLVVLFLGYANYHCTVFLLGAKDATDSFTTGILVCQLSQRTRQKALLLHVV